MRHEKILRDLDWNLVFVFLVIVDSGSITAAAQRLLRTQPSISNALTRLEQNLGHKLIRRSHGIFELTDYGRLVHEEAIRILAPFQALADLAGDSAELEGSLTFYVASHLDCPPFNEALKLFHHDHPNISLEIVTEPSEKIIQGVKDGTIALGFCILPKAIPSLRCFSLSSSPMGFFCGPDHPLFGRKNLTLEDLNDHNYISYESDHLEAGLGEIAQLGIHYQFRQRRVARSANEEEILRLIEAGLGFGPLTMAYAQLYLQAGRLWQLPPYDALPEIKNFMITNPARRLSLSEANFIDAILNAKTS